MAIVQVHTMAAATLSEGPGSRFAVWVQGCSIRCPGCCNPEMLPFDGGEEWDVAELAATVKASGCEGLTLLGGEPFDQSRAAGELARLVRQAGLGVMTFSGYRLEELRGREDAQLLLANTDMLKSGPYLRDLHSVRRPWIGSENQKLHHLTDRYRGHPQLERRNSQAVTLSFEDDVVQVTGWPGVIRKGNP